MQCDSAEAVPASRAQAKRDSADEQRGDRRRFRTGALHGDANLEAARLEQSPAGDHPPIHHGLRREPDESGASAEIPSARQVDAHQEVGQFESKEDAGQAFERVEQPSTNGKSFGFQRWCRFAGVKRRQVAQLSQTATFSAGRNPKARSALDSKSSEHSMSSG